MLKGAVLYTSDGKPTNPEISTPFHVFLGGGIIHCKKATWFGNSNSIVSREHNEAELLRRDKNGRFQSSITLHEVNQ